MEKEITSWVQTWIEHQQGESNVILSCTTFCLTRISHSRCPCKYGRLLSSHGWWKKHTPGLKTFDLAQSVSLGKCEGLNLEFRNFIMVNTKLCENYHYTVSLLFSARKVKKARQSNTNYEEKPAQALTLSMVRLQQNDHPTRLSVL